MVAAHKFDKFEAGEPVLCLNGVSCYEAKVLEVRTPAGLSEPIYSVHFLGWSKNWDEDVPASRLLKRTQENLELKERIAQEAAAPRREVKRKTSDERDTGRAGPSKLALARKKPAAEAKSAEKRTRGNLADSSEANAPPSDAAAQADADDAGAAGAGAELGARSALRLTIPQQLKMRLVTDWESVTREHKLISLPRSPSVSRILEDFCALKTKRSSHERVYTEIRAGLTSYFRQSLGQALLYRYERKQLDDLPSALAGRPLDEVYGAEHLLRLIVKLPAFLEATSMDADQRTVLQAKVQELLKFLQKNHAAFFTASYASPQTEYLEWWNTQEASAEKAHHA